MFCTMGYVQLLLEPKCQDHYWPLGSGPDMTHKTKNTIVKESNHTIQLLHQKNESNKMKILLYIYYNVMQILTY